MWTAMEKELHLRSNEVNLPIESIYFGGGSPSLLQPQKIEAMITTVQKHFQLNPKVEVTLEVNPDDVEITYLVGLKNTGINRLSLGVQSFYEKELLVMNRAHRAKQALEALDLIVKLFPNFTLDMIYGMPYSNLNSWEKNLDIALSFNPPHLSAYALTVEENTALFNQVKKGEVVLVSEEEVQDQYQLMIEKMDASGYVNYEFSNFGKPDYFSVNNQNYWKGKPYLGIGPAAHSYDGKTIRKWNVYNNQLYLKAIQENKLPYEQEVLSVKDQYNEYLMTGLRTIDGISLAYVRQTFGLQYGRYLEEQAERHFDSRNFYWDGDFMKISKKAKFLTDGIAADLFMV